MNAATASGLAGRDRKPNWAPRLEYLRVGAVGPDGRVRLASLLVGSNDRRHICRQAGCQIG